MVISNITRGFWFLNNLSWDICEVPIMSNNQLTTFCCLFCFVLFFIQKVDGFRNSGISNHSFSENEKPLIARYELTNSTAVH